jgi:hypothetical protein
VSFWVKPALAVGLAMLADGLFYAERIGSTLGLFALTLVVVVAATRRAVARDVRGRGALLAAALMAVILFDHPSALGWTLFWTALAVAVLSPRTRSGLGAAAWLGRLGQMVVVGMIAPALDLRRLQARRRPDRSGLPRLLAVAAVPAIGGALFLALFAAANPVISQALGQLEAPRIDAPRLVFWLVCLAGGWSFLRPRVFRRRLSAPARRDRRGMPELGVASVRLSLVVFNALFALQNGLDIAFLWSGGALPRGMTLAAYAHRGAYPLIVTALLAGAFVLVALRPGSATARLPWLRGLVVLWVAQNVFLVASSILRTLDYVQAYSLTRLRVAALLWMGLVAVGLVLICWRMLRGKTSAWLINANLLAAGVVLAGVSAVDLGSLAARWNVDHAREAGGDGPPLDLDYLASLDPASIVAPLSELETRPLAAPFRTRVTELRSQAWRDLKAGQADWRGWTWRGERALDRAGRGLSAGPPA